MDMGIFAEAKKDNFQESVQFFCQDINILHILYRMCDFLSGIDLL